MEFDATVLGKHYSFSLLNATNVLVSGREGDYILYKTRSWQCADDVSPELVSLLGQAIEQHLALKTA